METFNLKQFQQTIESYQMHRNYKKPLILTMEKLFLFLEHYLGEDVKIHNPEIVMSVIDYCLKSNASRIIHNQIEEEKSPSVIDITDQLLNLLMKYLKNEVKLYTLMQIIYQILNTVTHLESKMYNIQPKAWYSLYCCVLLKTNDKILRARILACMEIYIKYFDEFYTLTDYIWRDIQERSKLFNMLNETDVEILSALFDYFIKSSNCCICSEAGIISTIQNSLISSDKMHRKIGNCLLKKFVQAILSISNDMQPRNDEYHWNMYVNIFESIEEEHSHLILPILENVQHFYETKSIMSDDWLITLNKRILQHKNILIIRWAVEHVLLKYTCNKLDEETLRLLLEATNNNNLFNYENYFLPTEKFQNFLQRNNITKLHNVLGDINWKSIPIYIWLQQLLKYTSNRSLILNDSLLKIASRVRALTNYQIRQNVIQLMNTYFNPELEAMTLEKYVLYVETLYNTTDVFCNWEKLYAKDINTIVEKCETTIFSQRFYELLRYNKCSSFCISSFCSFLKNIPLKCHGWLRHAAVYALYSDAVHLPVLKQLYNLDLKILTCSNILTELTKVLVWNIHDVNQQLHTRLITLLISISCCEDSMYSMNVEQISLIQYMSLDDLLNIINKVNLNNQDVIHEIMDRLHNIKSTWTNKNRLICTLYNRLKKVNTAFCQNAIKDLCVKYGYALNGSVIDELKDYETKIFFAGDFVTGESRIEEAFNYIYLNNIPSKVLVVSKWLKDLQSKHSNIELYLKFLQKCHKEITEKKSRYFKNSTEHRAKFKIACAMCLMFKNIKNDKEIFLNHIWEILLNETNQLNVTIIYEYILGKYEYRYHILQDYINQISKNKPSQQTSIIVIAGYMFVKRKQIDITEFNRILDIWLPLTMSSLYQTRLYALLFLHCIIQEQHLSNTRSREYDNLLEKYGNIIYKALDGKVNELVQDIRIQLANNMTMNKFDVINMIAYATDTPFDEYITSDCMSMIYENLKEIKCKNRLEILREINRGTKEIVTNSTRATASANFVQRKIKPLNYLDGSTDLIVYNEDHLVKSELFVVASLIDKLPNLGGIARTCEVFGIKHLILDSKMHITKADFKNLSMTAENSLNIMEVKCEDLLNFLMEKQTKGFIVVGAEQTNKSKSFNGYKFPKKCILVLGHEKNGIPPSILNILNEAVEIPQSGNVRSLNVHVAAALFIWEYFKQHHIKM